jgi:soluble lytic murein transglycosylase-like protein
LTKRTEPAPAVAAALAQAGRKYGVDLALLRAVAWVESRFNPAAVGPKTSSGWQAMGLLQLGPIARAHLTDPLDPVQNADAGAQLLAGYIKRYRGEVSKALAAYNYGPANVEKYGIPKQVSGYVDLVLERHKYEVEHAATQLPPPPPPAAVNARPLAAGNEDNPPGPAKRGSK